MNLSHLLLPLLLPLPLGSNGNSNSKCDIIVILNKRNQKQSNYVCDSMPITINPSIEF